MNTKKRDALKSVDKIAEILYDISDAIWDASQLDDWEIKSARLQLNLLENLGFLGVQIGHGNIPNAFSARWGSGKPVIGFLGEFDVLPNVDPQTKNKIRAPLSENVNNCAGGQNLLGTGAIAAAYAVKEYLKTTKKSGTVIYYSCPVVQNGFSVDLMTKSGVFDELDIALSWYPGSRNAVCTDQSRASYTALYKFKSAITSQSRDAQNAIDLMNTGVQFLREHIKPSVHIHYTATDAKSKVANILQAKKAVCYVIQANEVQDIQNVYERVNKVARGASVMTDTELEIQLTKRSADLFNNGTLNQVLYDNLKTVELPDLVDENIAIAQTIYDCLENKEMDARSGTYEKLSSEEMERLNQQVTKPLRHCVIPLHQDYCKPYTSPDKDDISWTVPTARILVASWVTGGSGRTVQAKTMAKSDIAHSGIIYAAKVLAGAAIDLLNHPEVIEKAKTELDTEVG